MEHSLQQVVPAHHAWDLKLKTQDSPLLDLTGPSLALRPPLYWDFDYYLMKRNGDHPIGMGVDRNRERPAGEPLFCDVAEIHQLNE
ncbi:MAG: hypothetical protein HOL07_13485 [Rhodospirillaceae bacterium]|jgi:hypothetical protein|nr:hypothetical protein [Rhodospirillaceae bacterium]MBT3810513.1 hypothetical protein [Rhodospirillaceae bacterium]MBT3929486.1 hypothetical protein [Rhodospirillaceae bacterium]MBT4772968.1 hypothetical protein [Rhodospirillaceae bacterium]MBT5359349.1 hypothetical protein [Rhodospirillaceae bacterium]